MIGTKDYIREIQKFSSSQYLNSGVRITAGVMLPLFVLIKNDWLSEGIPFLWGALFVSLTDTPGPIHHRRNGMLAAILLNTIVVFVTVFTKHYQAFLVIQIILAGFLLSMSGIYGGRAGAVGSLALVLMLLNLLTIRAAQNTYYDSLLIAGGGVWYMMLSLTLYRLRPYRLVEQGLGENLTAIADYVRARAAFYKENADLPSCFNRVMEEQSAVQKIQAQTQELLFKTRKFVADASPRSRSMMMIYLDSLDLFEQTMHSYQNYGVLHKKLINTGLLSGFYGLILELAAGIEYIGIAVQTGMAVKKNPDFTVRIDALRESIQANYKEAGDEETRQSLQAVEKTLDNIQNISNRINKLVLYTRLEVGRKTTDELAQKVNYEAITQPVTLRLFLENLTLTSDTFRHAIRISVAMIAAYVVALLFSLSHTYWVLLTIVTIMKPVYATTRKRNIQRVTGTLVGVLLVTALLYFVSNNTFLLLIMVTTMLIGYSLLRVNYFAFVVLLTIFVIISFHFLNPLEFRMLIVERLVDTVVGSVIAAVASRFIFPVWGREAILPALVKMLAANRNYFSGAWAALKSNNSETLAYETARKNAVVALTNLSENFQRMLAEPQQAKESPAIHQLVIANHMLTSHIAALSSDKLLQQQGNQADIEAMSQLILEEMKLAEDHLHGKGLTAEPSQYSPLSNQVLNQLTMIYALARDIRKIAFRLV